MSWTEDQVIAYMAKRQQFSSQGAGAMEDVPDPGPESRLQVKCLRYCRDHGYPVWHDQSRKRNDPGWPDLIVFQPEGQVRLIELKAGNRKLRKEQEQLRRQFNWLGYEVHICRSYKRFIEIIEEDLTMSTDQLDRVPVDNHEITEDQRLCNLSGRHAMYPDCNYCPVCGMKLRSRGLIS